ncbi:MAG: AAA family ATPase [Flavobacteriales bacterium]|nr:AAA family ATPase [Flavobacteriales bacterium]
MKIKSIRIENLKGFENSGKIEFSPTINVLVGANNSGKSTIIKSCYAIQPRDMHVGLATFEWRVS